MNILVVGGAGYIGSHACLKLSEMNHNVIAYDNLTEGHKSSIKWCPLIVGDIADKSKCTQVIREYNIEAVIHFAASAYVGESVTNPRKYYINNVLKTLNLLEVILQENINKFIFSSTCATYGIPQKTPIDEASIQKPINPYGRSKWIIEQILSDYSKAYGLQYAILRYFNVFGNDPEGRIGENHIPETHLIPLVIQAAIKKNGSISIFGTNYDTPDGTAIRDYIHVLDLIDAHIKALSWLVDNNNGDNLVLNLGTGKGISVMEIIQAVEKVVGEPISFQTKERRQGDPPKLIASSQKAKDTLGWHPQYNLTEGIQHMVKWFSNK